MKINRYATSEVLIANPPSAATDAITVDYFNAHNSGAGAVGTWYSLTITSSNTGTLSIPGMTTTGKIMVVPSGGSLTTFTAICTTDNIVITLGAVTTAAFNILVNSNT